MIDVSFIMTLAALLISLISLVFQILDYRKESKNDRRSNKL